jgi:hypothetical protein
MVECPACHSKYVANTLFCEECGIYMLETEEQDTDPLEAEEYIWLLAADRARREDGDVVRSEPLTLSLRIGNPPRELRMALVKPIRLGRIDPLKEIYPDVDLTDDQAAHYGVSREHACIFGRATFIGIEDLGSTNGTLLNGKRLAPYLPERLKDGDQLQLGKLRIEVRFKVQHPQETPAHNRNGILREGVSINPVR